MEHIFALTHQTENVPPLRFTWNDETGEVSGPAAEQIKPLLDRAIERGHCVTHPYPCKYIISDPYHNAGQFGAVLSNAGWTPAGILHEEFARLAEQIDQNYDDWGFGVLY